MMYDVKKVFFLNIDFFSVTESRRGKDIFYFIDLRLLRV